MLKAVKVSAEFFNRYGRVVKELEAEDLSREVIRQLRDTGYFYTGYLTLYRTDNTVSRLYFDDQMDIVPVLNNLLEEVEVVNA